MNFKVSISASCAVLAAVLGSNSLPNDATAKSSTQEQRSVSTRTIPSGYKEVIQRVESKMQPTAVQVHETVDSTTGASKQAVAPIIQERRERILQTTILEPQTLETKATKTKVTNSTRTSQAHSAQFENGANDSPTVRTKIAQRTKIRTTDITRQPIVKKTAITPDLVPFPVEEPQIIQKIEEVKPSHP